GERSHDLCQASWVGSVTGTSLFPPEGSSAQPIPEDAPGMVLGHTGDGNGPGAASSHINQFSSRHGQGANFVFADGHVSFLPSSIDYALYKALTTCAGGEPVGGDY